MSERKLKILIGESLVGELIFNSEQEEFKLTYQEEWIKTGFPMSPVLAFTGDFDSIAIKRFLENLFPEGEAFEELLEQFRLGKRNTFRIIEKLGRETTGALTFISENGEIPIAESKEKFRILGEDELSKRLDERSIHGLVLWDGKLRLSIAGVQDKLPVTIIDGEMGFGDGALASTHILKFQKENGKIPNLVLNEYFCMKLAKLIGLDVANVELKKVGRHPVLIVERFDRDIKSECDIRRSHIIDGCQILNLPTTYKYERNFGSGKDVEHVRDGVSLDKLFNATLLCDVPAMNKLKMIDWFLFNLLISNSDAHGKNISFFIDKKGIRVAPFYDLVNISIYEDLSDELAMGIGDEFDPSEIFAFQIAQLCDESNLPKRLVDSQLKKMMKNLNRALAEIEISQVCTDKTEISFWNKLLVNVKQRINHFEAVIGEISKF